MRAGGKPHARGQGEGGPGGGRRILRTAHRMLAAARQSTRIMTTTATPIATGSTARGNAIRPCRSRATTRNHTRAAATAIWLAARITAGSQASVPSGGIRPRSPGRRCILHDPPGRGAETKRRRRRPASRSIASVSKEPATSPPPDGRILAAASEAHANRQGDACDRWTETGLRPTRLTSTRTLLPGPARCMAAVLRTRRLRQAPQGRRQNR